MTFRDRMAADLSALLNADEFGEAAVYRPSGASTTSAVVIVFGDVSETATEDGTGAQYLDDVCTATASRTAIRTAVEAVTGTARDPRRYDQVEVASGPLAGTWVIETSAADVGDGIALTLRRSGRLRVAGPGAVPLS